MKAYVNKKDIDFDNVRSKKVTQEWELVDDPTGVLEYQTDLTQFQAVSSITLFFPAGGLVGRAGEHTNKCQKGFFFFSPLQSHVVERVISESNC